MESLSSCRTAFAILSLSSACRWRIVTAVPFLSVALTQKSRGSVWITNDSSAPRKLTLLLGLGPRDGRRRLQLLEAFHTDVGPTPEQVFEVGAVRTARRERDRTGAAG